MQVRGKNRTKNSGRGRVEVGSGEDGGWVTSVTDHFRVVIKGDRVRNEIGTVAKGRQSQTSARKELYRPLGEVDGRGRDRRASAVDSATRTSGHGSTDEEIPVSYIRILTGRVPYRIACVSSVTPSPLAPYSFTFRNTL